MKLTDSDMLTEVVKVRGWTPKTSHGYSMIFNYVSNDLRAHFYLGESYTSDLSLPDLIADHEFMKAVYGEEMIDLGACRVDTWEKKNKDGTTSFGGSRVKNTIPAWQYHALEALKLLHAGENAISYLYRELPNGNL